MSLSIVVPVYNESENINIFLDRIVPIVEELKVKYEIKIILLNRIFLCYISWTPFGS